MRARRARVANFFGQTILADPAICDGEWHTVTGVWFMQDDSVGADGFHFIATNLPIGAEGEIAFDDYRITRLDNVWREIDNSCPVASCAPTGIAGSARPSRSRRTCTPRATAPSNASAPHAPGSGASSTRRSGRRRGVGADRRLALGEPGLRVAVPRWMDALPARVIQSSGPRDLS
jgi:hypothetical protein